LLKGFYSFSERGSGQGERGGGIHKELQARNYQQNFIGHHCVKKETQRRKACLKTEEEKQKKYREEIIRKESKKKY
jgi:hypothetical protein